MNIQTLERKDAFLDAYLKLSIILSVIAITSLEYYAPLIPQKIISSFFVRFFPSMQNVISLTLFFSSFSALYYFHKKKFEKTTFVLPWYHVIVPALGLILALLVLLFSYKSPTVNAFTYYVSWTIFDGIILIYCIWLRKKINADNKTKKKSTKAVVKVIWFAIINGILIGIFLQSPKSTTITPQLLLFDLFAICMAVFYIYSLVKAYKILKRTQT